MIVHDRAEIASASRSDLCESLTWWTGRKLFFRSAWRTGRAYQRAMVAAIAGELMRRAAARDDETAAAEENQRRCGSAGRTLRDLVGRSFA